jgi:hypothetical protein
MPRNPAAMSSASATGSPVAASVIMDAELWEIEQPAPWNVSSAILPSSTWAYTVISSPHRGLLRVQESSAEGSSRLFLGFL